MITFEDFKKIWDEIESNKPPEIKRQYVIYTNPENRRRIDAKIHLQCLKDLSHISTEAYQSLSDMINSNDPGDITVAEEIMKNIKHL